MEGRETGERRDRKMRVGCGALMGLLAGLAAALYWAWLPSATLPSSVGWVMVLGSIGVCATLAALAKDRAL